MLIALSRAFLLSRPPGADFIVRSQAEFVSMPKDSRAEIHSKAEEIVKASFARRPNYNDLVPALLQIGVCDELLLRCGLSLHIPLKPMLGSITRDMTEMLTKLQGRDFSCEYKYDGQRAQIHCDASGTVSVFSRHLELMTDKYPDLVALVPQMRGEGVSSFIMEGEVVAVDTKTRGLQPFQTLAGRARKDVTIGAVEVEVCIFAFDLMYLNGEELLDRPFRDRRELLRSLFVEIPGRFTWVKSIDATSADIEIVSDFFQSSLDFKCEGIMVKILDDLPNPELAEVLDADEGLEGMSLMILPPSPKSNQKGKAAASTESDRDLPKTRRKALPSTYTPDKRVDSWLKVKKDYNSSSFDTIDLIPVAGWHGSGRKNAWWSPILLAVRNPDTGSLEAVCKCISGFTDKFYKENKEKYAEGSENVVSRPGYIDYAGHPAVWFEPQEVWEMAFADITLSPIYTAGLGLVSNERGMSLRFPRFLKVRTDKTIEEASTSRFLASLYLAQGDKVRGTEKSGQAGDEIRVESDGEQ
jgi:DNA ligase 1